MTVTGRGRARARPVTCTDFSYNQVGFDRHTCDHKRNGGLRCCCPRRFPGIWHPLSTCAYSWCVSAFKPSRSIRSTVVEAPAARPADRGRVANAAITGHRRSIKIYAGRECADRIHALVGHGHVVGDKLAGPRRRRLHYQITDDKIGVERLRLNLERDCGGEVVPLVGLGSARRRCQPVRKAYANRRSRGRRDAA